MKEAIKYDRKQLGSDLTLVLVNWSKGALMCCWFWMKPWPGPLANIKHCICCVATKSTTQSSILLFPLILTYNFMHTNLLNPALWSNKKIWNTIMLLLYLQYWNKDEKLIPDLFSTLAEKINILHFTTKIKSSYSKMLKYFLDEVKSLLELKSQLINYKSINQLIFFS